MSIFSSTARTVAPSNEEGRRIHLQRFGYLPDSAPRSEPGSDQEWAILKADFATLERPSVPDLDALDPSTLALAEQYIVDRRALDILMDSCDTVHLAILREGAKPDLVEHYAVVRDAYEDGVEAFGELRSNVEKALSLS